MTVLEFVDAHAHHWHVRKHDWYPMLRQLRPTLYRDYLPRDYQTDAEAAGVRVLGLVHVSATNAPRSFLEETRWLDGLHQDTGWPSVIIGTIDPDAPLAAMEQDVLAQGQSLAFRGVRVFSGLDLAADSASALFELLGKHGWIFDLITRPDDVAAALPAIEKAEGTAFVLEHAGWPDGDSPQQFRDWRDGIVKLAALSNVDCKISGLGMALGTLEVERLRPFVETALDVFGVDRCFFGSNFPVDGIAGTYTELMSTYQEITASLGESDRHKLFSANATRRYRC